MEDTQFETLRIVEPGLEQHNQTKVNKNNPKNSKAKKADKKEKKFMNVICQQTGVQISNAPAQWLAFWGPGLGTGMSKDSVRQLLPIDPVAIRYYDGKTFCFVKYDNAADAQVVKEQLSGEALTDLQIMYLGYIVGEPPEESLDCVRHFNATRPEGLVVEEDFVTASEEQEILQNLAPSGDSGQSLKRRWVKHYGYDFKYDTNDVNPDMPSESKIPECLQPLLERMLSRGYVSQLPEQITLNYYLPGQGIPPHVDTHSPFHGPIISLSLNAPVSMDFRDGAQHYATVLQQRSLLVMNGASRYQWTHGIANRTFDVISRNGELDALERAPRLSLTFRILNRTRVCTCSFPFMCDSQKGKISEENAASLENTLVHQVYDEIASHFSATRHTPWPEIRNFVQSIAPEELLLDVGCGNGKYLSLRDSILDVGTDISSGLLNICRTSKGAEVLHCNCLQLPFRSNTFGAVICIAVIHHLATEERRAAAIQEILRVLKVGGQGLVYVWAKQQSSNECTSVYAKIQNSKDCGKSLSTAGRDMAAPAHQYAFLPIHNRESNFPKNDMLVPWMSGPDGKTVYHRYYHVFNEGELEDLLCKVEPSPEILRSYYDQGNHCVLFKKVG